MIPLVKRFERSEDDFEFFACSRYIQTQALPQIHEYVMKLSESDFIQKYEHLFNFIAVPEVCFSIIVLNYKDVCRVL